MKELTNEQYEQLPDFVKDDYTLEGETYKHAGVLKMKGTLDGMNSKLTQFEQKREAERKAEQERIDQARLDAYEKAKKENNVDEILRIEREKLEDEKRRINETSTQFDERMKSAATSQQKSIAQSLSSELATPKGKAAFERLIAPYIKVDPMTGQETYLNDDGSASSLNREQFIADVKSNDLFASLVKADIHSSGGGNVNGAGSGSANGKKFNEYNGQELVQMKRDTPHLYEQLRNEYYK